MMYNLGSENNFSKTFYKSIDIIIVMNCSIELVQ